jgi:hypothetical protein
VIRMFHCLFILLKIPLFSMPSSHSLFWHILATNYQKISFPNFVTFWQLFFQYLFINFNGKR